MPDGLIARLARSAGYVLTGQAPADWFGPQQPLPPQAPPDVAGRQFDYPFGFNLAVTPRSQERTGFDALRGLADSYDLLRAVIETRKDQMERLTWRIRPRALAQTGSASDPRLSALTQFFHAPDRRHGWAAWLRMLLEDLLVIDAPTLYKRRTRGGALYALEVLDGATIKRLIDDWGRTPLPPAPAYQQILKGVPAVDYAADELIYAPRNPRVHKAYGFSPVEQVQMSVNIALRRQIYQLQYYTEGNVPEALIGVPENWNPDQIRQFQAYWDSLNAGDTAERRHAKFVPGGVAKTFVPVREPAMKDAFDEWLARIVCYVFSVPPSAFTGQVNRATADTAQDVALSEGMAPLQLWVKHLLDRVIAEDFVAPDLEFAWDQDKDTDPAQTASIASDYVKSGIKSINEIRAELGLPPVKGGEVPKIQTAQGLMPLTQAGGGADTASSDDGSSAGEKLERFNPNHFGPGDRGGQFAPSGVAGSGDAGNAYRNDAVDSHVHIRNPLLVPVQEIIPRLPPTGTVLGTIRGLKLPPPEMPPEPKLPVPAESPAEPASADEPSPSAEKPSTTDQSATTEETTEEEKSDFQVPEEQPSGDTKYSWAKKIVGALKGAMDSGDFKTAETIAIAVDTAKWLRDQAGNIISSFDPPKDLSYLQAAAQKKDSDPGYEDHHIVEKGKQNDDLSPSDQARIDADDNLVRIPYAAHRCITAYYQTKMKFEDNDENGDDAKDDDNKGGNTKNDDSSQDEGLMTPRQYLRGKSFEERYNFGLGVMKICGVLRK